MKITTWVTTLMVAITVAMPRAASDDVIPPPVPGNLVVPAGHKPFLIGHAYGTQNYLCLPSASGVSWTLFGPQATLFDDEAGQIITHYLSPNPAESGVPRATWQHSKDTSSVWAVADQIYSEPDWVAPGAIPWLRLRVVGERFGPGAGDKLVGTKYIQRVNTAGGVAPATGCALATDVGKRALVPYTTDYVFYKLR